MHRYNEFGQITGFFPVHLDRLAKSGTLVKKPKGMTKTAQVGALSPIAFHFPDGEVDCGLPKKMKPRLKQVMGQLQDKPLLAVDVMAFVDPDNETELDRLLDQGADFLRENYSDEMAQDWLRDEKAHLNWLRQIPVLGRPMGIPGATVIDVDYLDGLPPVTAEKKRDYLRGGLPDFAIVNAEVPVKLGVVAEGLGVLQRQCALLLVGPAGTGKTTALMQIGLDLLRQKPETRVFWIDPLQVDPLKFSPKGKGPMVLLVDRADQWPNLPRFLDQCQRNESGIRVVLAARSNEWHRADFSCFGLQTLDCARLDDGVWEVLAKRIVDHGAADGGVGVAEIIQRLRREKARDLLAAMILATRGQSFQEILRDLIARLVDFPDGRRLVAVLAAVAGMETRQDPKGRTHPATLPLLRETFRFSREGLNGAMSHLKGELTLVRRDRREGRRSQFLFQEVHTRHPIIAETLWKIFSQWKDAPIDLEKMEQGLFKGASRACDMGREATPERSLTSAILETRAKEGPVDVARRLFSLVPEYGASNPYLWQIWARFEWSQGNVGSLEKEYTARWLFSRAVAANPKDAASWQAWALLEAEKKNIGSVYEENTARWLFSRAVAANPKDVASWQAWALLEAEKKNFGSVDEENTARWLFSRALAVEPENEPALGAWREMEEKLGNYDTPPNPINELAQTLKNMGSGACFPGFKIKSRE
ncbi:MAG: hypothetical protein HQL07_09895 [Nitrospirae bacterium]|nr:hypothetical protein [Magnetococcales bacterium]